MIFSLLGAAFMMGFLGGAHCLAMCAAPCAFISGTAKSQEYAIPVESIKNKKKSFHLAWPAVIFHLGRLGGYGLMGALAAWAVQQLAWFSDRSSWLYPLWAGMHLGILFWGLAMLVLARQPAWLDAAGRWLWVRVQPLMRSGVGPLVLGMGWALLPCGLLYSALQLAALSGTATAGAGAMVAFGIGTGLWLWAAPLAWGILQKMPWAKDRQYERWAARAAGLILTGIALWALWMNLYHEPQMWCR